MEGPAPGHLYPADLSDECSMGTPAWLPLKPLEMMAPNLSRTGFSCSGVSTPTSFSAYHPILTSSPTCSPSVYLQLMVQPSVFKRSCHPPLLLANSSSSFVSQLKPHVHKASPDALWQVYLLKDLTPVHCTAGLGRWLCVWIPL